jgi:ABC-2 type transport system permease protein
MRNIWALVRKEFKAYFTSPIAYVVLAVFLVLSGYFFFGLTAAFNIQSMHYSRYQGAQGAELNVNEMVIRPLFYNMSIILLLMIPMFTMRMYAEEKKGGTLELLLTSPLTHTQLILGKFFSGLAVYLLMMGLTGILPGILFIFGTPDPGPILAGYVGILLMGAAYISVGCMASSLTENQIIAAVITFGILLFLWVIGWAKHFLGPEIGNILAYLSIIEHFNDFAKGIIDSKHVIYYLSFIFFNLFLTRESIDLK